MKLLYLIIPSLFLPAAGTPHLSRARAEGALPGFGAGFRTGIGSSVTLALQQLSGSAQHSRPAQEQFPAAGGGFWAAAVVSSLWWACLVDGWTLWSWDFFSLINSGILWVWQPRTASWGQQIQNRTCPTCQDLPGDQIHRNSIPLLDAVPASLLVLWTDLQPECS